MSYLLHTITGVISSYSACASALSMKRGLKGGLSGVVTIRR